MKLRCTTESLGDLFKSFDYFYKRLEELDEEMNDAKKKEEEVVDISPSIREPDDYPERSTAVIVEEWWDVFERMLVGSTFLFGPDEAAKLKERFPDALAHWVPVYKTKGEDSHDQ